MFTYSPDESTTAAFFPPSTVIVSSATISSVLPSSVPLSSLTPSSAASVTGGQPAQNVHDRPAVTIFCTSRNTASIFSSSVLITNRCEFRCAFFRIYKRGIGYDSITERWAITKLLIEYARSIIIPHRFITAHPKRVCLFRTTILYHKRGTLTNGSSCRAERGSISAGTNILI
ncbi:hypothetical protein N0V95_001960 [Ascochyta clinopodiicola]|nr:hypothetical protein N0V95_001960 [Ascochyta clinopodiicola]